MYGQQQQQPWQQLQQHIQHPSPAHSYQPPAQYSAQAGPPGPYGHQTPPAFGQVNPISQQTQPPGPPAAFGQGYGQAQHGQQPAYAAYGSGQAWPGTGAPPPSASAHPIGIQPLYPQTTPAALPGCLPVYLGAQLAVDPMQPYAAVPLRLPSYDPSSDVEVIRKATKGFGTDENALNKILCLRAADQIQVLSQAYKSRYGKDLVELLKKETSGYHARVLCTVVLGPLEGDVQLLHDAIAGVGTKETLVTEILVGRHPHEIVLLRHAFAKQYNNRSLDKEVLDDLSLKTKDAFAIVLQGRWLDNGQVQPHLIEKDLNELLPSFRLGFTNELLICSIIFARSPTYLQALVLAFRQRNGKSLTSEIKQHFRGHLRDALLFAVEGGKRDGMGIWRDAKRLEAAMMGVGTADVLLIARIVRAHWDRNRLEQIKLAYQQKYRKPLVKRVRGETSGHYRDALVTMLNEQC